MRNLEGSSPSIRNRMSDRVVDCAGLENRFRFPLTWVQIPPHPIKTTRLVELVDTTDLKSVHSGGVGSSPTATNPDGNPPSRRNIPGGHNLVHTGKYSTHSHGRSR